MFRLFVTPVRVLVLAGTLLSAPAFANTAADGRTALDSGVGTVVVAAPTIGVPLAATVKWLQKDTSPHSVFNDPCGTACGKVGGEVKRVTQNVTTPIRTQATKVWHRVFGHHK
jgi:hypothetical protein